MGGGVSTERRKIGNFLLKLLCVNEP